MSKKRKTPKTGARNIVKKPALRRKHVSPAQARRLAARYAHQVMAELFASEMFASALVHDGAAMPWHAYNVRRKDVWLVYPNVYRNPAEISSSKVVVVCKHTGRVLYAGSAHDEG